MKTIRSPINKQLLVIQVHSKSRTSPWFCGLPDGIQRRGIDSNIFTEPCLDQSQSIHQLFGGLLGIILALVFGTVFLRGTNRINLSRFFKITSGVLLVLVAVLFFNGWHEFFEVGILPSNDLVMRMVGYFARSSAMSWVTGGMIFVLIGMVIYDLLKISPLQLPTCQVQKREEKYIGLERRGTPRWEPTPSYL